MFSESNERFFDIKLMCKAFFILLITLQGLFFIMADKSPAASAHPTDGGRQLSSRRVASAQLKNSTSVVSVGSTLLANTVPVVRDLVIIRSMGPVRPPSEISCTCL